MESTTQNHNSNNNGNHNNNNKNNKNDRTTSESNSCAVAQHAADPAETQRPQSADAPVDAPVGALANGPVDGSGEQKDRKKHRKQDKYELVSIRMKYIDERGITIIWPCQHTFLLESGYVPCVIQETSSYDLIDVQLDEFKLLMESGKVFEVVEQWHWSMDRMFFGLASTKIKLDDGSAGHEAGREEDKKRMYDASKYEVVFILSKHINSFGLEISSYCQKAFLVEGGNVPIEIQEPNDEDLPDANDQLEAFSRLMVSGKAFPAKHSYWDMDRSGYGLAVTKLNLS
jgi:hypothetical protein